MFFPPDTLRIFFRQQRSLLTAIIFLMVVQVGLVVIMPLPFRAALDRLTGTVTAPEPWALSKLSFLGLLALASLLIGLTGAVLQYLEERLTALLVRRVVTQLRLALFAKVLTRKMEFHDRKRKMDLLGRLSSDVQNLELYFSTFLSVSIRSIPSIVFAVAAMMLIQWRFAAVLVGLLALNYIGSVALSRQIKKSEHKYRQNTAILEQDLLQSLNAMPLIKSMQGEARTTGLIGRRQEATNSAFDRAQKFTALLNTLFYSGRHLIFTIVLALGGWAILRGQLTLGGLFAFISYLEAMSKPILEVANYLSRAAKASVSLERLETLERELADAEEALGAKSAGATSPGPVLSFEQVRFAYADGGVVLRDFSLSLSAQRLVALVGESGVGKSTLIRLLNRLVDPTGGQLRMHGIDLREARLVDVRRQVCVVSQDPFILSTSLRDNLSWALDTAIADDEIWTALGQAAADDFVRDLEHGLNTPVGEGGVQLSGGQAKRISLARGFLRAKISDIVIFDEPTSGLDPLSAQLVLDSIAQLAQRKTLVMFSTHRMSEILTADEVLFLSRTDGPQLGKHQDLNMNSNAYRRLAHELDMTQHGESV